LATIPVRDRHPAMIGPERGTGLDLASGSRRWRNGSCIATVLVVAMLAVGCLRDAPLNGVVRSDPLDVAQLAVPDVTDATQRGRGRIVDGRLQMVAGESRLLLVYFGFLNCPDICPTTLMDVRVALGRIHQAERDRVDIVFVTVDPERDTPEAMATYLRHYFATYHAVRAEGDELEVLLEAFLSSAEIWRDVDGAVIDVSHTALLYAVDDRGLVVVEWPFGTSVDALAQDLRILLDAGRPNA